MNEVMKKVEYLSKDTSVGSYKAISHDKVIGNVRGEIINNGIIITINQYRRDDPFNVLEYQDSYDKKKVIPLYMAFYEVKFINIDSPEDFISINVESHSRCSDEKSPGIAYSYAFKMALLKQFMIETGKNEESPHGRAKESSLESKKERIQTHGETSESKIHKCTTCGKEISDNEYKYSTSNGKPALCYIHQRDNK
jgi:hypothetical protein